MNGVMLLIAIVFAFLYGSINYYIGLRVWQNLGIHIPFLNAKVYWVLFSIIAVSYIFTTLVPSFLPSIISNRLNIIGSYWMAMMFYLILMLSIIDLIKILNKKFVFIPKSLFETANVSLIVTVVVGVFLFGIMAYGTWSARNAKVTKYDLNINKINSNKKTLKVIMVSDIHLGVIVDNNRLTDMVNKINDLNPDIVLIAGDIIDSKLEPFINEKMGDNFKRIKSKYGVYACLGNHEGFGANVDDVVKNFENAGINVLRDKAVLIDNRFYVIGREDTSLERITKVKRKDLSYLVKDLDKSKPLLLMDHQPGNLSEPETQDIDLQFQVTPTEGSYFQQT